MNEYIKKSETFQSNNDISQGLRKARTSHTESRIWRGRTIVKKGLNSTDAKKNINSEPN